MKIQMIPCPFLPHIPLSSFVSISFPFFSGSYFRHSCAPHLLMISRLRWKQEEDTRPLCIFICPSVPWYSPICSLLSVRSLCIPSACQHSSSPPNTSTIHPLLSLSVPYCTASPPAPPPHPRWTEWTLCSKINFEMNEAMAVCARSMILCQKMLWRLCLDLFTAKILHFCDLQLLNLCSSVSKKNNSSQCQKEISI